MNVVDYTLCYNPEDGKLHIGRGCSEEKERFVGDVTDEIADIAGYEGDGLKLKLKDFSFFTSADLALAVPGGATIEFEGKNELAVVNDSEEANVGVLYSSGDLTLSGGEGDELDIHAETANGLWSRAVCARAGDLAINGGHVQARGGKSKKSCGLYAGGRLWIEIGSKGVIAINAGRVTVVGNPNAVRAAEGKLRIAQGAVVENAVEYDGQGAAWTGDCLTQVVQEKPLTIAFHE